jgi:hypothetical protein
MRGILSEHRRRYGERGRGVGRSFDPRSTTRGTACLTKVCVQGDLKAVIHAQAGRVLETTFFGYRGVLGGFEEPSNTKLRARRTIADSSGVFSRR